MVVPPVLDCTRLLSKQAVNSNQCQLRVLPAAIRWVDNLQPFEGQKGFAVLALVDGVGVGASVSLQLAASEDPSAVLLWIPGQAECGKYAAHCRQLPGRLVPTKLRCVV